MIRTRTALQHVFLAFAACLIFSCSQITDAPEIPALRDTSRAHLVLSVSDASQPDATQNSARDIVPGSGTALLTDLQLTGTFDGDDASQTLASAESLDALSEQDIELKPGDWSLTLSAKLGGVTYTGMCTAKLSVGENTVTFTLSPVVGTHYGGFSLEMAYTGGVTKVLAKVTASDSTTEICAQEELTPTSTGTQAGKVTYAKSMDAADEKIEAGLYRVVIEFYGGDTAKTADGNLLLLNTYREFVRIAAGRTSTATRTIDLNEVYTITYYDVAADGTATEIDGTTVTFNANAPAQFSRKSSAITLPAVAKDGWIFDGWYTDASCTDGNEITAVSKGTGHDVTLYAKWQMIPYAKVNGVAYGNLSATVTAITNATGDITVELSDKVSKADVGTYETTGTIAHAVKNSAADSISLDMSGATAITTLQDYVFYECLKISAVTFPETLTEIPVGAFYGISNLTQITIPSSVAAIGKAAFFGTNLTSATFSDMDGAYRWKMESSDSVTYVTGQKPAENAEKLKNGSGIYYAWTKVLAANIPLELKVGSLISEAVQGVSSGVSNAIFTASETPPSGTVSYYLDTAEYHVPVWLEGTTVYYYAAGYTDSNKKLPLNKDCSGMFSCCSKLASIDLTGFDASGVTEMNGMFWECSALTAVDLTGLDTSSVTNMNGMFFGCSSLTSIDLTGLDTSSVTLMNGMFYGCSKLTSIDLTGIDTPSVTDMDSMFLGCSSLTSIDLTGLDTSSVTNMDYMFRSCYALTTLDLSGFDTAGVINMSNMFESCSLLRTIMVSDSFVTTGLVSSGNMFLNCTSLVGGEGTTYDSTKTDATYARLDAPANSAPGYFTEKPYYAFVAGVKYGNLEDTVAAIINATGEIEVKLGSLVSAEDLGNAQTDGTIAHAIRTTGAYVNLKVLQKITLGTSNWRLFEDCAKLLSADLRGFDTSNVTDMSAMFIRCTSLASVDLSSFDTARVTDMVSMFNDCASLTSLDLSGFNTAQVTDINSMFDNCTALTSLDLSGFDTASVEVIGGMFSGCSSLTSLDVSSFNTTNVTIMCDMFKGCSALTSLDVSSFNTARVTNMNSMFNGCSVLTSLDVSGFDTSNVTDMGSMFEGCSNLKTLDLSGFDTSNVTDMGGMFYGCSDLELLDVSGFDTASATTMGGMFYGCSNLKTLDVGGFETPNVMNMGSMFHGCLNLESLDVSGFVTTSVTNIGSMFRDCSKLETLDISGFNTSLVTLMDNVFNGCSALKTVYASDSFVTTSVTNDENMFAGCASLVGGSGTTYDSSHTDAAYAHIDGGTTNPGYFSAVAGSVSLTVTVILPDYAQIPVTKTEDAEYVTFALNDTTGAWKNLTWIFDGTEYTEQTQFVLEKASLAKGSYDLTLEATYHNSTTGKDEPYSYFVQIRVE